MTLKELVVKADKDKDLRAKLLSDAPAAWLKLAARLTVVA